MSAVFALSLLVQVFVVLAAFCCARSLGLDISITPFFLYLPVISAVSTIPVSINALGLQEGAFILFFTRAGLAKPEALSLAFLFRLVVVILSVLGGLLWLARGGSNKRAGRQTSPPQGGEP